MHRIAWLDRAAGFALEGIGLDVGQMAFDVPKPVFAVVAAAFNLTLMDELTRRG